MTPWAAAAALLILGLVLDQGGLVAMALVVALYATIWAFRKPKGRADRPGGDDGPSHWPHRGDGPDSRSDEGGGDGDGD